jgi:hypothetical protein
MTRVYVWTAGIAWMEGAKKRKGARIEIQPRFKIQYPMKNQCNVR